MNKLNTILTKVDTHYVKLLGAFEELQVELEEQGTEKYEDYLSETKNKLEESFEDFADTIGEGIA